MAASAILQALGGLGLTLGLAVLYLRWRQRSASGLLALYGTAAGWLLLGLGGLGWAASGAPVRGLALGCLLAMTLALAAAAGHSLTLVPSGKAARSRAASSDGLDLGPGYWGRFAMRLAASLILVPGLGILAGLVWLVHGGGDEATRLMLTAIIAVSAMAGALVAALASPHPYRMSAVLVLLGAVLATAVFLPELAGLA